VAARDRILPEHFSDDVQVLRSNSRDLSKGRGIGFIGNSFRLYAGLFARDVEQFGLSRNADIPSIEATFVLTLSDGPPNCQIYDTVTASLGNFVERAVINQDIQGRR
jgi:hypothetical protein